MTKQKKQSFLYGSTILIVSMLIVKIIGAIFKIPLTNILHESGMGYFNSAYTIYTTVYALTVTGLSAAVARMVAENAANGRYMDVKKILRLSTISFALMGIFGSVVIGLSAKAFCYGIKSTNSYWSIIMIAPAILFCCQMASYRGYYEGLSDMKPTAVTQIVEAVIKLFTGLSFAHIVMDIGSTQYELTGKVFGMVADSAEAAVTLSIPYGAAGAMLGVSVSTFVGFAYIYLRYKIRGDYITKKMLKNSPAPAKSSELMRSLIRISLPITMGAVVIQLSAMIDVFTIQSRLASLPRDVLNMQYGMYLSRNENMSEFLYGCFTSAVTLFNLIPSFTNIFGKSALPNVTTAWTQQERTKIKRSIESVIRITMIVASPMAFGIAFMSKPILKLVYSNLEGAVEIGAPLLTILGIAGLFLALVTPMNAIFQGINRMDLPVKFLFIGAVIKLILNVILIGIPSINIFGGAISTLVCYMTIIILSIHVLRKKVSISLDFSSILIKPVISGFICGFCGYLCKFVLTNIAGDSIITIVSIGIASVCYVISLGFFKAISREDVIMLPNGEKICRVLEKLHIIR